MLGTSIGGGGLPIGGGLGGLQPGTAGRGVGQGLGTGGAPGLGVGGRGIQLGGLQQGGTGMGRGLQMGGGGGLPTSTFQFPPVGQTPPQLGVTGTG